MTTADDLRALAQAHDLAVYGATWCPDCRRLDAYFEREKIRRRAVDIEAVHAEADRLVKETGKRAIPFVLVDGRRWVRGYHKESQARLDPALLLSELRSAAARQDGAGSAAPPAP